MSLYHTTTGTHTLCAVSLTEWTRVLGNLRTKSLHARDHTIKKSPVRKWKFHEMFAFWSALSITLLWIRLGECDSGWLGSSQLLLVHLLLHKSKPRCFTASNFSVCHPPHRNVLLCSSVPKGCICRAYFLSFDRYPSLKYRYTVNIRRCSALFWRRLCEALWE